MTPQLLAWSLAPGLYQMRKSRQTGHYVGVYEASFLCLSAAAGPYVTVCEEHGTCVHHEALQDARGSAARPLLWCEGCRQEKGIAA